MYTDLKSYQNAVIVHDFTIEFVKRYIPVNSRTRDQMEQAARSGKQNIAEATSSSKQKPKSEPMLLGVASASLKELLEDYQDYLRQHRLSQWDKNNPRALRVRNLYKSYTTDKTDTTYKSYKIYLSNAEDACNAIICLINQTTYLLDNQIRAVERLQRESGMVFRSRDARAYGALFAAAKREREADAMVAAFLKKEKPEIYGNK